MIKQMYAQAGKPGVSRSRFVEQWRDHGGKAMMCPDYFDHVSQYVQSDVLPGPTTAVGGDSSYFGIGELWFPDMAARDAAQESPSRAERVLPHGQAIFGHAHPISLLCSHTEHFRRRHGLAKVYAFLVPHDGNSGDAFQARWIESAHELGERMVRSAGGCAYSQCRPLVANGSSAALDEFEFDAPQAAVDFVLQHYLGTVNAFAHPTVVVTEQIVLYRRSNYQ